MFQEIKTELMSMISKEPIERVTHMPSIEVAKCMELIFNIKTENIEKVYTEDMGDFVRLTVVYSGYENENSTNITSDMSMIGGKVHHIIFVPSQLLNIEDGNAVEVSRAVIKYISLRVGIIIMKYDYMSKLINDNTFDLITFQSIPVIASEVMRELYSGQGLSTVIHMSLGELIPMYKSMSEEGINSILNLLDEGLTSNELIDSGFICSIVPDDKKYPGIWAVDDEDTSKDEPLDISSIPLEILEKYLKEAYSNEAESNENSEEEPENNDQSNEEE